MLYALHEAKDQLVMIEKWTGREALKAHSTGPALAELNDKLDGKLAKPIELLVLRPHPAGSAALGTV